jgi:16S rRNA (cytidine1402-2'-O)-methyltransferase
VGTLFSVAVPLGNLKDITLRAIETLQSVDYIACEDTRNTKILLDKYNISTKVIDCHKFNEKEKSKKISEILDNNGTVALVSDAGTPAICDPGCVLEFELLNLGHKIVPIPGASALTTFLSAVPRNNEFFSFVGFIPRTKLKKEELFQKFNFINFVFYESPNRIKTTLQDINDYFGKDRNIAIGRELTKIYEEIKIGTVEQIIQYYNENILKGEIVAMIFADNKQNFKDLDIITDVRKLLNQGFSVKDTSKILSTLKDIPKNKVYDIASKVQL